jgi:hypothetical protein
MQQRQMQHIYHQSGQQAPPPPPPPQDGRHGSMQQLSQQQQPQPQQQEPFMLSQAYGYQQPQQPSADAPVSTLHSPFRAPDQKVYGTPSTGTGSPRMNPQAPTFDPSFSGKVDPK